VALEQQAEHLHHHHVDDRDHDHDHDYGRKRDHDRRSPAAKWRAVPKQPAQLVAAVAGVTNQQE